MKAACKREAEVRDVAEGAESEAGGGEGTAGVRDTSESVGRTGGTWGTRSAGRLLFKLSLNCDISCSFLLHVILCLIICSLA